MRLYHFTSEYHLPAIRRHGLAKGDVPTNLAKGRGRNAVWFTSSDQPAGHGLGGSAVDKTRFRMSVDIDDRDASLHRWIDWARVHVKKGTSRLLHKSANGYASWHLYFGVVPPKLVLAVTDMRTGEMIVDWGLRPARALQIPGVPYEKLKKLDDELAKGKRVSLLLRNEENDQLVTRAFLPKEDYTHSQQWHCEKKSAK